MFAKNYESDPLRYYTPEELYGIPDGTGLDSLYNPYLVTPPRHFAEALQPSGSLIGAFVAKERNPISDYTLQLMATVDSIYWPSYAFRRWRVDGTTGTQLSTDTITANPLSTMQIYQMRDGSLWATVSAGNRFYELDPLTFAEIAGTSQTAAKYGATSINWPLVDRAQNVVIIKTNNEGNNQIGVYDFTSGALVRRINISGQVTQVFPEDATRCYLVSSNGMLNLVDYSVGHVISTLRAPPLEAGTLDSLYAWDRFLRRLLVFQQRADDTDGTCLSTFSGYYPVPLALKLSAPVAIKAPRAHRDTPFLCRVFGDAGEGISGVKVTPTAGTSTIAGAPPFTDRDGEAVITLTPDVAGSDTLDLSATV